MSARPALDEARRSAAIDAWVRAYMAAAGKRRRRPTTLRFSLPVDAALDYLDRPELRADHDQWSAQGFKPARVRVSLSAGRTRAVFSFRYAHVAADGFRTIHAVRARVTFSKAKR